MEAERAELDGKHCFDEPGELLVLHSIAVELEKCARDRDTEALTGDRRAKLDAELHRLRGLALRRKDPRRAQESFESALAIARRQGATPFEARALAAMG